MNILDLAKLRKTSVEVAEVIVEVTHNRTDLRDELWLRPTENDAKRVLKLAFEKTDNDFVYWNGRAFWR